MRLAHSAVAQSGPKLKRAALAAVSLLLLAGCSTRNETAYAAADTARGQQLFTAACAVCHYPDSRVRKVGPGLAGLYHFAALPNGAPISDANVSAWIRHGSGQMPAFNAALSEQQLRDLVSYLRTL